MGLAGTPHCAAMCGAPCAAVTQRCGSQARHGLLAGFTLGRLLSYAAGGAVVAASVGAVNVLGSMAPVLRPLWTLLHLAVLGLGLWLLFTGRQPAWWARMGTAPVMAVPGLLKRCLGNLIDNAVLHGERATVVVDDSALQTVLLVRDAGPGIPEAELGRVFEPFHRLEASRNRATGGTGLGLSIARNIAQTHGGDIRLRNLPQGGLEAALVLPRSPTHQAGSSPITMRPSLA